MIYIFLVETNADNKSDERYIRSLLDFRYNYLGHKLKFIYMEGKSKYDTKETEIKKWQRKYNSTSKVFMCIDLDNDIKNRNNSILNKSIINYCDKNRYEFIWFNEDIEQVFWGKSVSDSQKKDESKKFYASNNITNIKIDNLRKNTFASRKTSNIIAVLDRNLTLK